MTWEIVYTEQAQKDARKLASSGLINHAASLLDIFQKDLDQNPPPDQNWWAIYLVHIHNASIYNIDRYTKFMKKKKS